MWVEGGGVEGVRRGEKKENRMIFSIFCDCSNREVRGQRASIEEE